MAASTPEPKEKFFDHSLNFFKRRLKRPAEETQKKISKSADPYSHVGSTKSKVPAPEPLDYSKNPNADAVEEDQPGSRVAPKIVASTDPLAEAYRLLRKHYGVRFGAQRSDGSWEVFPLDPIPTEEQKPAAPGDSFKRKVRPPNSRTLDPATEAALVAELKRLGSGN